MFDKEMDIFTPSRLTIKKCRKCNAQNFVDKVSFIKEI